MTDQYNNRAQQNQHIFISYAREDGHDYAEYLHRQLNRMRIPVWRDERNLNPYQDFSAEIEMAIRGAFCVAVCLTPSIAQDPESFVRREILYAQNRKKPIVPLLFPGGELPVQIAHLTYVPFHQPSPPHAVDFDTGFKQFMSRLTAIPKHQPKPAIKHDPFLEYLQVLYDDIVDDLDKTVFSLISLHATNAPDQVDSHKLSRRALPMSFTGTAVNFRNTQTQQTPSTPQVFKHFHEAFTAYNGRVLLLGKPGAGKTTTLLAYAREAIIRRQQNPNAPLPILAPVSNWNPDVKSPLSLWLGKLSPYLDETLVEEAMHSGNVLLFLDGLDELGSQRIDLSDPEKQQTYDPRLRFIGMLPPNCKVVVTCRVEDYAEMGEKVALEGAIILKELTDAQIQEYLVDQPHLLSAIKSDKLLYRMSRTPLLLSLLTFAYNGMGQQAYELQKLKDSPYDLRDTIFRTYIERRFDHEKAKTHRPLNFDLDQIYTLLGLLAMDNVIGEFRWVGAYIKHRRENVIDAEDFEDLTKEIPLNEHQIAEFKETITRLHLLTSGENNTYRFVHLLLRDFLAFNFAVNVAPKMNVRIRLKVAKMLGQLGDRRAIPHLISMLHDEAVRKHAVTSLIDVGELRIEYLLDSVLDEDIHVRNNIAYVLGRMKDNRAVPKLIEAFHDTDPRMRISVVEALGDIGDERAIPTLEIAKAYDEEPLVRRIAEKAIERIRTPQPPTALEA